VVRELLKKSLLAAETDQFDGRRNLLSLSEKGKSLLPQMQELWNDIAVATHQMISQHQTNIMDSLREVERSFFESNLHQRVAKITQERRMDQVEIVEYQKEYKKYFKSLNYAWISKYFKVEETDQRLLTNPDKIIAQGGAILFARLNNQIVLFLLPADFFLIIPEPPGLQQRD